MVYKLFGKTGKRVSALGMGVAKFLPEQYNTPEGMEHCADLIVKAWEYGVNYFDVAPVYCGWRAEEILGLALKRIDKPVNISTKSSSTQDPTADAVRRRLEISLKRLGLDKITFYNMWGILDYDQYLDVIKPGGPYEGALRAKEEGLIEHICFSSHCTGEEIEKILEDDLFEGMTIGFNAVNFKYREKGLFAAQKKGLGVVVMNPLYGGVIPQNPERFDFIRNSEQQSLAQAGLLFCASQDAVSVVLSGMTKEEEIIENASCFHEISKLSEKKIFSIKQKIVNEFDALCTGCNYCEGCPQKIMVNRLMLAYNQYILSNNSVSEFHRYMSDVWRYTEEMDFSCEQCGYCERKCTQHLPIIKRIREINEFSKRYLMNISKSLKELFEWEHGKKLGIYASGPYARRLLIMYQNTVGKIETEIYFFDSNPHKWGKEAALEGYTVYSPNEIERLNISKIVIASEVFYKEIYESIKHLEEKGVIICKPEIRLGE